MASIKETRLKISQLNLHKSVAATANHDQFLSIDLNSNSNNKDYIYRGFVSLIQEPHFNHKSFKISGFSKTNKLFVGQPNTKNRAGILVSKNLNCWQINQFCNPDMCSVGIHLEDGTILVLTSCYMEYSQGPRPPPPPPELLKELTNFCRAKGWSLLVGSDSNCHHSSYGSTDDNQRGVELIEWLSSTNMHILNRGNDYTFSNSIRKEVIDITIGDTKVLDKVVNWHVSKDETMSDHRRIEFDFITSKNSNDTDTDTSYRNVKKTNWDLFGQNLSKEISGINKCTDDIDLLTSKLERAIIESYNSSCKIKYFKGKRKPPWWNSNLSETKRKVHRANVKHDRYKTAETKEAYDRLKSKYRSDIKIAKTEGWKRHCDELSDLNTASRIQKVLAKGNKVELGTVKNQHGDFTCSPEETLNVLLDTHFPSVPEEERYVPRDFGVSNLDIDNIVNKQAVRACFKSFSPYKSPGPDGIYPAMLQHGSDSILELVIQIYKLSITQGKIPKSWLRTKVVFIPKVGKLDYSNPKNLRPISLTSFLLKGLERLVFWYLNRTTFRYNKLHKNLFSYKESISTEDALHKLVHRVEKSLEKNEITGALFLDIDAAFSKASINSIINNMVRKEIDPAIIKWAEYLLINRIAEATLNGETCTKVPTRGTPQGGIMSIIFWNLEPDDLLDRFPDVHPSMINAFADDLVDLVTGIDISTIEDRLNQDAKIMEKWARDCGLSFSASKTKIMVFTNKRNVRDPIVKVNGELVEVVENFRYLGVTLDSKLTWTKHIDTVCRKANIVMSNCRKMLGKNWGLKPSIMRWMYTSLVRPILTYGCLVWLNSAYKSSHIKKLERVQRRGCLATLNAMKTTATQAMEIIVNLKPIEIHIQGLALRSYLRLKRNGNWSYVDGEVVKSINHTIRVTRLAKELTEITMPIDKLINKQRGECNFTSIIKSRGELINHHFRLTPLNSSTIHIYTDGSRTKSGSGFGYTTKGTHIKQQGYRHLGGIATVFQAETMAIEAAAKHLVEINPRGKNIKIYIDSQAAIKAISKYTVDSICVARAKEVLNTLGKSNCVELIWIPAHLGHRGNEIADRLAKLGSSMNDKYVTCPEPYAPVPISYINGKINEWADKAHQRKWMNPKDLRFCRQTRMFLRESKNNVWKHIQNKNRTYTMYTCQVLTGHANTNLHLFRMKIADTPECQQCGFHEETVEHLIGSCPRYNRLRLDLFGNNTILSKDFHTLSLRNILSFMKKSKKFIKQ